jgi:hypothetical protein
MAEWTDVDEFRRSCRCSIKSEALRCNKGGCGGKGEILVMDSINKPEEDKEVVDDADEEESVE